MRLYHPIDWSHKLRSALHMLAFVLVVSAVQTLFRTSSSYRIALIYSLCIGMLTWALIDFGRHYYPSAQANGWPRGWAAWLNLAAGVVLGFLVGTSLADWWCGWPWETFAPHNRRALQGAIVISLLCASVAGYYFHTRHRSRELRDAVQRANSQAAEAKLKLLETQLEPHMMFNTLANLRAMVALDPEGAQRMLDHLIAYLRATLGGSRATHHSLQAEFDRLRDYLALMAVRMGPRLRTELLLPPELADVQVPTLLLQPLVENAIKHGLEPSVPGGTLTVSAARHGDQLVLSVQDDGVGVRLPLPAPAHRGFGLVQVHERLCTAFGEPGVAFHMDISQRDPALGSGTVVTLRMPWSACQRDRGG